jgi:menaquinone-dependent protoporphyrinogen IX oxidase
MSEIPVFYATTEGQTRRIAEALVRSLARDLAAQLADQAPRASQATAPVPA